MATKPNSEHPSTEADSKATMEESLVIQDMGRATEKTMGCCGPHGEHGFPPFNNHQ